MLMVAALALAAILICSMLFPREKGEETLVDQALHAVGIGQKKDDDSAASQTGAASGGQSAGHTGSENVKEDNEAGGKEEDVGSGTEVPPIAELPSEDAIRVDITQEKLRELLENAMQESFPLTLTALTISSDGTISMKGSAERDKFVELLESQQDSSLRSYILLLQIAPSRVDLSGKVGVSYDTAAEQVSLDPRDLTVAGIGVPTNLLPDSMTNSLNAALTGFFAEYGHAPTALTLHDGYMTVYFE